MWCRFSGILVISAEQNSLTYLISLTKAFHENVIWIKIDYLENDQQKAHSKIFFTVTYTTVVRASGPFTYTLFFIYFYCLPEFNEISLV